MSSLASGKSVSNNLPAGPTEAIKGAPPHGFKGVIAEESFLSASVILMVAGTILAAAILAAVIAALVLKVLRKKEVKVSFDAPAGNRILWEELRQFIARIKIPTDREKESLAWENFASDVSLCLRRGVELRTASPVAERTTQEIEQMLQSGNLKLPMISEPEFKSILARLDAVRFGGVSLSEDEAKQLLTSLKDWTKALESDQVNSQLLEAQLPVTTDDKGGFRVFDA